MNNPQPNTRDEWYALIEEFEKSGMKQIEFCKQKDLILCRFGYYLRQYRKEYKNTLSEDPPSFSPVAVHEDLISNEIKIELPNGFRCHISSSIRPDQLKKILGALLTC